MADQMRTELCLQAIYTTMKFRDVGPDLCHQSDHRSQYSSADYSRLCDYAASSSV